MHLSTLLFLILSGVVVAPDRQPIAGAIVSIDDHESVATSIDGRFRFDVPSGVHQLRVTRAGFQTQSTSAAAGDEVSVTLKPVLAENIVVSGIRAVSETPVTKTDVSRADIEKNYYGQDIPMLLRDTPSINAYAEGGVGGSGYSYMTVRGLSSTRINFTLDGVPLADSEDMATYFVDLPDLAHSLESIQVQRGTGTSTVGAGAFGGSVNLESVPLATESSTDVWLGGGSFGTKLASIGFQSGALPGGFAAYGRLSLQQTDGFREHSGTRQHNLFLSAARQSEDSQLKITGLAAHEYQQNSYFAADAETLRQDLRANPMSPEDRDSFGYNLAQVQYMRSNMTASAFFQRGYGWYRLDGLQYGLDGLLMGTMLTYSTPHANYGIHVNQFRREHTLEDAYRNYGTKGEANAFAKFTWDTSRWHFYSDNQIRTTDFHYHGDVAIDPIRWTFFNPKLGVRYGNFYASAGISRREPTRTDLFQGEDNASFAHDLHAVHPERLIDFEAGWDVHSARGSISSNIYVMNFHNEIAATGELSDIGLPLRRNVDRSYRRGIEVNGSWQIAPSLRWSGNANVSRNRIHQWLTYFNVNPILTPTVILNQALDYTPSPRWSAGAVARYVGKSYLDNTNRNAFTTPSFVVVDGTASFAVARSTRLMLQVNNLLNRRRVFPSGYVIDDVSYFYPQATRNALVTLRVHL
ncbi:MAG TPA: TonB-dependent receptor [Thermoanaerobaculia bacterium]